MRIDQSTFLYRRGIPLLQPMVCPECKKPFVASEGRSFFCDYIRYDTQEEQSGIMFFCSDDCFLDWIIVPDRDTKM